MAVYNALEKSGREQSWTSTIPGFAWRIGGKDLSSYAHSPDGDSYQAPR
jgi:hypothetical protein